MIEMILGLLILLVLVLIVMVWRQQKSLSAEKLQPLLHQLLGTSAGIVSQQTQAVLQSERSAIQSDLLQRHQAFEKLVNQVQQDLAVRQGELRSLEKDRSEKFSQIIESLENHRKLADELRISTTKLAQVLSSNQTRGEWGERILEDILRSNGLVEGIHYARQHTIVGTALRPDIALLLPDNQLVAIDVKFPYQAMQRWAESTSAEEKKLAQVQFEKDVKAKVQKVAEYIVPQNGTLEYAILFVPNELIFSVINQKFPALVDQAMAARVLMVSPFTFLVVARTVLESYRNFKMSDTLREVTGQVTTFLKEWEKFYASLQTYGKSIDKLQRDYEELTGPRARKLQRSMESIVQKRDGLQLQSPEEEIV